MTEREMFSIRLKFNVDIWQFHLSLLNSQTDVEHLYQIYIKVCAVKRPSRKAECLVTYTKAQIKIFVLSNGL